ncbi:transporter [bacterium]|nr:transporter [bacterium]
MIKNLLVLMLLVSWTPARAQDAGISDNSFLIEEAYNQEPRVVQHISNIVYSNKSKEWGYAFTQEWPLFSQAHQISYTFPYAWTAGKSADGLGDIAIHYRYQLWEDARWAAFSPRFSIILPTGNEKKQLGSGKTAYQVNLPLSKRFGASWAVHFNAGATVTPGVSAGTSKQTLWSYTAGGSMVWLVKNNLNMLVEFVALFDDEITGGQVNNRSSYVVNPGLRYAYNAGSLQIVPGLCLPVELNGEKQKQWFIYLSFEHPF